MASKKMKWLLNLTKLGVITNYENDVSRRVVFSNVIFISLPAVYLVFGAIDYESYLKPIGKLRFDQFIVPIIIAVCFLGLWLNRLGRTTTSRIMFLVLWPLLLHQIPIRLLQTPSDYYLAFPFGIVFHSMLIQLMFSHRKEPLLFWFFLAYNLAGMIQSPAILMRFDIPEEIPTQLTANKYYLYDGILYWLLFNLVLFYILDIIDSYIKKTGDSKKLIEEQKEELNTINQNLEELVFHRTSELGEQNEKLRQYAFFNAHLLRGPFCRIQGLIQLQDLTDARSDEGMKIKAKLNESIEELDTRIREIQKLVATKEMGE